VRRPALLGFAFLGKITEVLTGIRIPYTVIAGPGLYLGHFGPIIINGAARIGSNCNLSQGVTLGVSGRAEERGAPILEDRVYVGANATIVGRITVGDDVVVAANSLVNRDVAAESIVMGVPATVVSSAGSGDYVAPGQPEETART
jgi:serine O-acetyltransferase